MNDDEAFLSAIAQSPDDAPRLVYADWLEERDDPRAGYLRVTVRLSNAGDDEDEYESWCRFWELWYGVDAGWRDRVTGPRMVELVGSLGLTDGELYPERFRPGREAPAAGNRPIRLVFEDQPAYGRLASLPRGEPLRFVPKREPGPYPNARAFLAGLPRSVKLGRPRRKSTPQHGRHHPHVPRGHR